MAETSKQSWVQRAAGQRDFIPSPEHHNEEVQHTVVLPMPEPEIRVITVSPDDPYWALLPPAAITFTKKLQANGWRYDVRYCEGPWPKKGETFTADDGSEEKIIFGQAPSVVVRFARAHQVGWAMWLMKPWTKDAKFPFHAAQLRPLIGKVNSARLRAIIQNPEHPLPLRSQTDD